MTKRHTNEGLADLAQMAEQDHEVQMARAELYKLAKYSIKLHDMLKKVSEQEGLEGWVQSKITKAADYISSVYHHLDYDFNMAESVVKEKAESKAQQRFMGMVHAAQKGEKAASPEVAKVARSMKKSDAKDFAKTKHKGLPDRVDAGYKNLLMNRLMEKVEVCSECGKPSWRTLSEEKQKGVDGKVCWKGYKRMGTKEKGGKTVDNCVKM